MRKSRLSQHKQNKLIELFVAGVTARTASKLVNVNKNTATITFIDYAYSFIKQAHIWKCLKAKLKPMKAISAVLEKANVVAVLLGKSRYSGFSNEMARFIPSLSLMRNHRHYCQLSERKLSLIALCTRIPFVVMMCLMSVNLAIFASITARILLKITTT